MNTVLYARVSTDKQAEKDLSIPAQLQAMRDYARQRDWTVVDEFIEPGASATTSDRPELQRLITRVKEGQPKVEVVVVVQPAYTDDWPALVDYVRALRDERFEDFISSVAANGPLVPSGDVGQDTPR